MKIVVNSINELFDLPLACLQEQERQIFSIPDCYFEKVVLFGAGNLGKKSLYGLRKIGIMPQAFSDNNPALWGTELEGIPVLSPQEAIKQYGKSGTFVVTIWMRLSGHQFIETQRKLTHMGCNRVVSFAALYYKYSDVFLPFWCLDLPSKLSNNVSKLKQVFDNLSDDESRDIFLRLLNWRVTLNFQYLPLPDRQSQYFNLQFFHLIKDEIFVDCGAFDGDSLKQFLHITQNIFGCILAFEPDPYNFSKLKEYANSLPEEIADKIILYGLALGAINQEVYFSAQGGMSSAVVASSELLIRQVCFSDIVDYATYIKMDIEGAEYDALLGALPVIKKSRPVLAVAIYHTPDDIWRIPCLLIDHLGAYNFYIRSHAYEGEDTVLYAVPCERVFIEH